MRLRQIRSTRVLLFSVVVASLVLRWALVSSGGQFFFPDESRYRASRSAAQNLWHGQFAAAVGSLRSVEHIGFKVIGVIPASVEAMCGENPLIPAAFFSLFGVGTIFVVWLLALRIGADEQEAFWAAFLLAGSNSMFYYSSHLLPYDVSMTFGVLALYVGLRDDAGLLSSLLTGCLAFLTFVSYNGYWVLAACAMLAHLLPLARPKRGVVCRSLCVGLGFAVPLASMLSLGSLLGGRGLLRSFVGFAGTVNQGDYSEGATLPFEYLWAAEGPLVFLWLFLVAVAVVTLRKARPRRVLIGLGGVLLVYGCLVVTSVLLRRFVVYGRLVRQMLPFMVLAAALAMRTLAGSRRWGHMASAVVVSMVLIVAGLNFRGSLLLTYPADFVRRVQMSYPDFVMPKRAMSHFSPDIVEVGHYRAHYLKYIYPCPRDNSAVRVEPLIRAEHPQSYPPFLYEGFTPAERAVFRSTDFSMLVERRDK